MGNTRILSCGKSLENYYICINNKVVGFTQRSGEKGDLIYFSVKVDKKTVCGARGILDEVTDYKPWEDSDRYVQVFRVKNIEYCNPFDLSILKEYGGTYYGAKYFQRSKSIKEVDAVNRLDIEFANNKISKLYVFESNVESDIDNSTEEQDESEDLITDNDKPTEAFAEDDRLDIMGTFQTIKFKNETDPIMGLEPLVSDYFFKLFTHFKEENTILIAQNRLFGTTSLKNINNETIPGIKGIPDALLISYDKENINTSIKINLIEYECYGEGKIKSTQKFNYLNGIVIPQLIRFASTFSIVTDDKIRKNTIDEWVDKIMNYIDGEEVLTNKIKGWIKELNPNVKERQIDRMFDKELRNAFESNIRIILVIDELTPEQKETIKNIINSFKLNNTNSKNKDNFIEFSSYIVRLEQKIGIIDKESSFALSFQE
ncbi:hypothetical protein [Clostridium magnum]|uniref:Uncharacterized protein n=1 Tax=Clostridium magnum DSM 2767 TaxID=1121326 RepID=A0A161X5B0_9CLOT|nr:hypothetical protein [Clostridium magnum]KZL89166.1 hypothetical protein CLMAG_53840 [Clostridium magnum DSM 2767]SHJ25063.1 hypothetical protein SAMN02745944_05610 [Clostridium magnum DSM 2767]